MSASPHEVTGQILYKVLVRPLKYINEKNYGRNNIVRFILICFVLWILSNI